MIRLEKNMSSTIIRKIKIYKIYFKKDLEIFTKID